MGSRTETQLGKLVDVRFGIEPDHGLFGLIVAIRGKATGCGDMIACRLDDTEAVAETMRRIAGIMVDAGVDDVEALKGAPIEFTFENGVLQDWRILTEVL